MLNLTIAPELKAKLSEVAVGWIAAGAKVAEHDAELWREIEFAADRFRGMTMVEARKFPAIKSLREAYKTLGNDPNRYRGANEALLRRISQGKELYRVNTVVDINSLVTLGTLFPGGTFDFGHVQPPITFRICGPGRIVPGHRAGEIKLAGLPVFADQLGPFGSTTSDSERTMVRLETTRILMVVISFRGTDRLNDAVLRAVELLEKYARAADVEAGVVE